MDLTDILVQQLGGSVMDQMSSKIGSNNNAMTEAAIKMAIPAILGGLAKNASKQDGVSALNSALDRDHDGSILDNIGGFLGGNTQSANGAGILKHILGGKRNGFEQAVSQNSGLNAQSTSQLFEMLAPIVMGSLGKQKRTTGLNESGLGELLGMANKMNQQRSSKEMSIFERMLDADGDGDVKDDVANMGMKILGNFFKKKR